ncbi:MULTISPECIES: branched-chain amino acid ABC transporter permease [unclassified Beijerinckia]|uniref:branched-chain amino acid ABC transporter permease n=1 Tax=unclassified Beijerinckia TaxID=2638183 RepID=UPI000B84313B|nr:MULTISPECIES: branched-chain amino acid ABC transporter permease [unclassified Beijerinckia]
MQALFGQLLVGLINGSFYAMLSLGLAIIFGLLGIVNIAQGAFYMLGGFITWMLLNYAGIGYFWSLLLVPLIVGLIGAAIERTLLNRIYNLDHMYGLLLTFGIMMFIQGMFVHFFATAGKPYAVPAALTGGYNLGFMFLPKYRGWVVLASLVLCLTTWYAIEKTSLGRTLRAATENPTLTRAFGINVPALMTIGFGIGVALAGAAGVLAAPIYPVSPLMGAELIITVFAVVVVGGLGSIMGSIVTSLMLGLLEGLTKVFYPQGSNMVIFVIMLIVLLVRPAGLFGRER